MYPWYSCIAEDNSTFLLCSLKFLFFEIQTLQKCSAVSLNQHLYQFADPPPPPRKYIFNISNSKEPVNTLSVSVLVEVARSPAQPYLALVLLGIPCVSVVASADIVPF